MMAGTYRTSLMAFEQFSDENRVDSQVVALALEEVIYRRRGGPVAWLDIGCGDGAKIRMAFESCRDKSSSFFHQWKPTVELVGVDPRSEWKQDWEFPGYDNVASKFFAGTAREFFAQTDQTQKRFDLITIIHSVYEFPLSNFSMPGRRSTATDAELRVLSDLLRLGDLVVPDGLIVVVVESNTSAFTRIKERLYPKFLGTLATEEIVENSLRLAGLYSRRALSRATVRNRFYADRVDLEDPMSPRFPGFLLQSSTSNVDTVPDAFKVRFGKDLAKQLKKDVHAGSVRTFLEVDDVAFISDMNRMGDDDIG